MTEHLEAPSTNQPAGRRASWRAPEREPDVSSTPHPQPQPPSPSLPQRRRESVHRTVKVTRIPTPTYLKDEGLVVIPEANGVAYYSGDDQLGGAHRVSDGAEVVAKAKKNFEFAENLNTTWRFDS